MVGIRLTRWSPDTGPLSAMRCDAFSCARSKALRYRGCASTTSGTNSPPFPDVREDVTEIVLNLKRIRLKRIMELNGETRAHLYVQGDPSGERVVTAGDVVWPAEVDVINPEQVIATIDSPDGVIDMDIWITQDRGYKPAELQESYSIGEIPIDAIYTPIERVNFVVEHTRVGPMTDYDRLIIEVLTDGTIEPDDALAEAARILMTQAQVFAGFTQGEGDQASGAGQTIPDEILNKPLARAWPVATSAQCAAQPADRASRPGAHGRPRTASLDSQFRATVPDRAATKAGRVRLPAGRRCRAGGHRVHGRARSRGRESRRIGW